MAQIIYVTRILILIIFFKFILETINLILTMVLKTIKDKEPKKGSNFWFYDPTNSRTGDCHNFDKIRQNFCTCVSQIPFFILFYYYYFLRRAFRG